MPISGMTTATGAAESALASATQAKRLRSVAPSQRRRLTSSARRPGTDARTWTASAFWKAAETANPNPAATANEAPMTRMLHLGVDARDRAAMIGAPGPRRVLMVSADMGEGHNAAARAIREGLERSSPGCETAQVDALRVMGRYVSWLIRSVYHFEITRAPWIYQFFYDALWRYRWFELSAKRLTGSWCGRRLARVIKRFDPTLIVSTYPIGSAGLHWLRRHRGLQVATCTFITDFAAHPFWVFPGIDVHCVMHEVTIPDIYALGVHGVVRVVAPPVGRVFRPGDRGEARLGLRLRSDAFVALVTGGAWGVGTLEGAVQGLLAGGERFQVIVACGRNDGLLERLRGLGVPRELLVPIGFTDAMADLMTAADVVITNAGGVTSLEAFAANRPLVIFDPIAGHGKANAVLMEQAGLAVVCRSTTDLLREVGRLDEDEMFAARIRTAQRQHLAGKELAADLGEVARVTPFTPPLWRQTGRRIARATVAVAVMLLMSGQASLFLGTRLARAARGAPPKSNETAIVVAGSLRTDVLLALEARARAGRIPVTFFVEGQDVWAEPNAVRRVAGDGFEVEAGTWSTLSRWSIEVGDLRAELTQTIAAIRAATGRTPTYIANPGGRFSLLAVAVTDQLSLRRVVFRQVVQAGANPPTVSSVTPNAIVEVRVSSSASPESAASALTAVAMSARGLGLELVSVAQIDRTSLSPGQG